MAASQKDGRLLAIDVSRAYFYAPARRLIYVELPDEAGEGKNICGRLLKSLYGTRDAATNWAAAYTSVMENMGFIAGHSNPCLFKHKTKNIVTLVHGDDFLTAGSDDDLTWMHTEIAKKLEVKTGRLGPKPGEEQLKFLNRIISWEKGGIRYEADPRHQEIVREIMQCDHMKPVSTPGEKGQEECRDEDERTNPQLEGAEATCYRAVVARLNFLAQDRADLQYSVKEVSRWMSKPRRNDWPALRRIARYLAGRPRATLWYPWQRAPAELVAYTDTDWAGCRTTRRSTSGGVILHGLHVIKTWSRQQTLIALSSAEAELYGLVKASSEILGAQSMAKDFGHQRSVRVYADASAALGVVHRKGLGKIRHIDTNTLWVQQAAYTKKIQYLKVLGLNNPADIFTKHLPEEPRTRHSKTIGLEFLTGRAGMAPELCGKGAEKDPEPAAPQKPKKGGRVQQ